MTEDKAYGDDVAQAIHDRGLDASDGVEEARSYIKDHPIVQSTEDALGRVEFNRLYARLDYESEAFSEGDVAGIKIRVGGPTELVVKTKYGTTDTKINLASPETLHAGVRSLRSPSLPSAILEEFTEKTESYIEAGEAVPVDE